MAAPVGGVTSKMEEEAGPFPGYPDTESFVKYALGKVVATTKSSTGLPQSGDEYDFYRSFPGFRSFCETQGDRLLHCMSRIMQYHGCRSYTGNHNKDSALEDKMDLLVDANDAILERVGMMLDEASGVHRSQEPILPAGLQAPKTIISSWNRRSNDTSKKHKTQTFRLLQAKNIVRPQLKFKEKIDNTNTPFVPKIFIKPNAQKPLPETLRTKREKRPEDLDVPAALADFIHQQRLQQPESDMLAHPYRYELDHFDPLEKHMEMPDIQPFVPLNDVPYHFINTLDDLVALNEKLLKCSEFAVDLEHHSYRSFLGLTCLLQISTRSEDFIIDPLELRSDLYILNESFTDPSIVKVLHGADSDIEWLQKDFGLYIVNLFDTHQGSRLLNLARNSLDHLLKHYCSVVSDKKYQLADWRIRPLPQEMIEYARADTHFLLYIYDRMRTDLLNAANGKQNLLHLVWQKSKEICLKKFVKPIFTDESYLELYQKQKRHLNTQQLSAFRLLYAWRDKMARQEDESTGYVLPNHMMFKISEELPREPQGIMACCNPVPPLVRQQINELILLIQEAREVPLLKSDVSSAKKKGPMPNFEKMENQLFGPHDTTYSPYLHDPYTGAAVPLAAGSLFNDEEPVPARPLSPVKVLPCATLSIFNDSDETEDVNNISVAKQKARSIMESFDNPFRMFLPSDIRGAHASQAAKLDPNTKMFEISNRWKLVSIAQQEREAKAKEEAKQKRIAEKAARKQAEREFRSSAANQTSVREQTLQEDASRKRERIASEPGAETKKSDKKRLKHVEKTGEEAAVDKVPFIPFDYSKSDFKVFAGSSRVEGRSEFDPNKQAQSGKQKNTSGKKRHQSMGNKSMSFMAEKSNRGFKHSWPRR